MATNGIPIKVSDNATRIRLNVSDGNVNRAIEYDNRKPYYVGARAYVEQLTGAAKITVIDKEGTTTATVHDGFSPSITHWHPSGAKYMMVVIQNRHGSTQFEIPYGKDGQKGAKGDTGNGIASVTLNDDYTLTLLFTDGTSVTTDSIRGEKGEKGDDADIDSITNAELEEMLV